MVQLRGEQIKPDTIHPLNLYQNIGVYNPLKSYTKGSTVIHNGSIWVSSDTVPATSDKDDYQYAPGSDNRWIEIRSVVFQFLDTVDDLRAFPKHTSGMQIGTLDLNAIWQFDETSTAADDGVNVVKPNDIADMEAGRWVRRKWFADRDKIQSTNSIHSFSVRDDGGLLGTSRKDSGVVLSIYDTKYGDPNYDRVLEIQRNGTTWFGNWLPSSFVEHNIQNSAIKLRNGIVGSSMASIWEANGLYLRTWYGRIVRIYNESTTNHFTEIGPDVISQYPHWNTGYTINAHIFGYISYDTNKKMSPIKIGSATTGGGGYGSDIEIHLRPGFGTYPGNPKPYTGNLKVYKNEWSKVFIGDIESGDNVNVDKTIVSEGKRILEKVYKVSETSLVVLTKRNSLIIIDFEGTGTSVNVYLPPIISDYKLTLSSWNGTYDEIMGGYVGQVYDIYVINNTSYSSINFIGFKTSVLSNGSNGVIEHDGYLAFKDENGIGMSIGDKMRILYYGLVDDLYEVIDTFTNEQGDTFYVTNAVHSGNYYPFKDSNRYCLYGSSVKSYSLNNALVKVLVTSSGYVFRTENIEVI